MELLKKCLQEGRKKKTEKSREQEERKEMVDVSSVITLNVNSLNTPIKRQGLVSELKNTTQLYPVCKNLTSNIII